MKTFSIFIGGRWTTEDFSGFFHELEMIGRLAEFGLRNESGSLNQRYTERRRLAYKLPLDAEFTRSTQARFSEFFVWPLLSPAPVFEVHKISYASPGHTDLGGLGKIVEQARIFITDVVDRVLHAKDRKQARELKEQEILSHRILNAERLLKLADKIKLNQEAKDALILRALEADGFLEGKVIDGQITGVSDRSTPLKQGTIEN